MDSADSRNGFSQMAEPIPDINTDISTGINNNASLCISCGEGNEDQKMVKQERVEQGNNSSLTVNQKEPKPSTKAKKQSAKTLTTEETEALEYLNELTGRRFRTNAGQLMARIGEGFTLEDVKAVIQYKAAEWMGTDFQKYLKPETLFRANKFEGYLNDALQQIPVNQTKGASNGQSAIEQALANTYTAEQEDIQAMEPNAGLVRNEMDQCLRLTSGPDESLGALLEGDYARANG
jgi:uncharacterized phage protein (TIGR02220 family)